jgi:hypothetical protein
LQTAKSRCSLTVDQQRYLYALSLISVKNIGVFEMVTQAEKRRATQKHMDAITADSGPVYGVRLIDALPLGGGAMMQAMPSRKDLIDARSMSERTVAGYEVLLSHYRELLIYKEAMDSMAAQMIHPKMTGLEMAKIQLGRT